MTPKLGRISFFIFFRNPELLRPDPGVFTKIFRTVFEKPIISAKNGNQKPGLQCHVVWKVILEPKISKRRSIFIHDA